MTLSERIRHCNSTPAEDRLADAAAEMLAALKQIVYRWHSVDRHDRAALDQELLSAVMYAKEVIAKAEAE